MIAKKIFGLVAIAAIWLLLFSVFGGLLRLFYRFVGLGAGAEQALGAILILSYLVIAWFVIRSRSL